MKRRNVVLDEKLLDEAVELTGEKTYSAAINRALGEMVRKLKVKRGIERFQQYEDPFWPGYAEELFGKEWAARQRRRESARRKEKEAGVDIKPRLSVIRNAPVAKKSHGRKRR